MFGRSDLSSECAAALLSTFCGPHRPHHTGFSRQHGEGDGLYGGLRSVEGKLIDALQSLVGRDHFCNLQVSSRTDRGVHALKNTCHVDIRPRSWSEAHCLENGNSSSNNPSKSSENGWDTLAIQRGLNYYLHRNRQAAPKQISGRNVVHRPPLPIGFDGAYDIRILAAKTAPDYHNYEKHSNFNDWHARFTATRREYVYRILTSSDRDDLEFGAPFEWDRAWRLRRGSNLDVASMREAAMHLVGTHDFSSFRGKNCERPSPVVTLLDMQVKSHPDYHSMGMEWNAAGRSYRPNVNLVTVSVKGRSFIYRQVRNIVGCLVKVGQGKLPPASVKSILQAADRGVAPAMAPAHGLFLVDVEHEGFAFC